MADIPPEVAHLAFNLTELTLRNTATVISDRVRSAKANRDQSKQITELTEIINDLLADKTDLITLAQLANQELAAQNISNEDLQFITETLIPTVETFLEAGASSGSEERAVQLAAIKTLVAPEMLSVLQIVGFNFRDAIGRPLTELVASLIRRTIATPGVDQSVLTELSLRSQILALEVAKDGGATSRFAKVISPGDDGLATPSRSSRRK